MPVPRVAVRFALRFPLRSAPEGVLTCAPDQLAQHHQSTLPSSSTRGRYPAQTVMVPPTAVEGTDLTPAGSRCGHTRRCSRGDAWVDRPGLDDLAARRCRRRHHCRAASKSRGSRRGFMVMPGRPPPGSSANQRRAKPRRVPLVDGANGMNSVRWPLRVRPVVALACGMWAMLRVCTRHAGPNSIRRRTPPLVFPTALLTSMSSGLLTVSRYELLAIDQLRAFLRDAAPRYRAMLSARKRVPFTTEYTPATTQGQAVATAGQHVGALHKLGILAQALVQQRLRAERYDKAGLAQPVRR